MPKPVILLAFANDRDDRQLSGYLRNVPEELRRIEDELEGARRADKCELKVLANATLPQILDAFQHDEYRGRIAIFHYGGHANSYQLDFESREGASSPAHGEGLAAFLREQTGLRLVFLNGCATRGHMERMRGVGIPAVISTSRAIEDRAAMEFAARFYRGLGSGASVEVAYREAAAAVRAAIGAEGGGLSRDLEPGERELLDEEFGRPEWELEPKTGVGVAWTMGELAGDLTYGLPAVPEGDLPNSPFRHIHFFEREHAEVFFGRGKEVRDLYEAIRSPQSDPVVLLYGQSGVGKSSLLAAGLLPRLEESHVTRYERRDPETGLLSTLRSALELQDDTRVADGWWALEAETGRPALVIIDQVEEIYSQPIEGQREELRAFLEELRALFVDRDRRPQGKLLLGFRKEYLAEVEQLLMDTGFGDLYSGVFLERLERQGIMEAVSGPARVSRLQRKYGLTLEDDLPGLIADDLLHDPESALAPTLQILLTRMWKAAKEKAVEDGDRSHPHFGRGLYEGLRKEGLLLDDFLGQQSAELRTWRSDVVDSGLALDFLTFHTTAMGVARSRTIGELQAAYEHNAELLPELLQKCKDLYLLVEMGVQGVTRLAHDTLAPLVRHRFEESDAPGQRTRRILESRTREWKDVESGTPLDEADLQTVERGAAGMRAWSEVEDRLVQTSRRIRRLVSMAGRHPDPLVRALLAVSLDKYPAVSGRTWIARAAVNNPVPTALLRGHERGLTSAAFSPDSSRVVTASEDNTARVCRADGTGDPVVLRGHEDWVTSAAFSPDGAQVVTASNDRTARVWYADGTGDPVVLRHERVVTSAAFSPDGEWVATAADDNTARVWRADGTGDPVVLQGHEGWLHNVAFSPDGERVVTASWDNTARVWRADGTGDPVVLRHQREVTCAVFSPDSSRVVTASYDNTARVWRADGISDPVVLRHEQAVTSAAFNPDGARVVTTSEDNTARVWRADGIGDPVVLRGHENRVSSVAFSPGGERVVTASEDNTARVCLADGTGDPVVLRGHESPVTSAGFSPDGAQLVTASNDHTARVWRADGTGDLIVLHGHADQVTSAAFSPDGARLATALDDGTARVWRADGTGDPVVLRDHGKRVKSVAFSPDGVRVVTASDDGTAQVWHADGSGDPVVLRGHDNRVTSAAFDPDGERVVTTSDDNTARVWHADGTGDPVVLSGHGNSVKGAAFSPDGEGVATASWDNTARVWRADGTGDPVMLRGHEGWVHSVAFSPDGERVVTASNDRTARVWRADGTGDPVVLRGHEQWVHSAAFSPSGERVVTASSDRTAQVWRADGTGDPVVLGHESAVNSAAFSPDGKRVVTASGDNTARVWRVTWKALIDYLSSATTACLTPAERQELLLESPEEAQARYEECEGRHGRTPVPSE